MEAEERPKAFEELGKQIQQYMKFVEAYKMKVKRKDFKIISLPITAFTSHIHVFIGYPLK